MTPLDLYVSTEETRVANVDQIINNVNSTVMESMNLVDHIVPILVDDSVNLIVYYAELFGVLINAPTKINVDNV